MGLSSGLAQQAFDEKKAVELEQKMRTQTFNYSDFLEQFEQMKNMGPLSQIAKMLPGVDARTLENADLDDRKVLRVEAIIKSMTPGERELRDKITPKRKERIAKGSGTTVAQVNNLIKQFEQMQKMLKQFSGMNMNKKMKRLGKMGIPKNMGFPKF